MSSPDYTNIPENKANTVFKAQNIITPQGIFLAVVALISIVGGLALPWLELKFAFVLILIFPVTIIGIYILKNPYAGVFLYYLYEFLRPYDFIPALQPMRLALVLEVVTLASWIFHLIRFRIDIKWLKFNTLYLLLVCSIAIGVYLAVNNFMAYNIFLLVLVNFVMFVIASNTIDNVQRLERIIWLLILIHVYYAVVGTFNYILNPGMSGGLETSGVVGSSFISDENDFAMTLNVMIPIIFFMGKYYRQKWKSMICYAILVLFIIGIVASFSRGGLVGMVAVVTFCIYFSGRRVVNFSVAIVAALLLVSLSPDKYMGEIKTIGDTSESTADARIRYWAAGGRIYLANPIIGVGAANGGIHMPAYLKGEANPNKEWGRAFHGLFPQIAAELGTIGLGLYLIMLYIVIAFLNRIRKKRVTSYNQLKLKYFALGFLGSLVAFFTSSTFLSTAYYPQLWTIYTLAISMYWIQHRLEKIENEELSLSSHDNDVTAITLNPSTNG